MFVRKVLVIILVFAIVSCKSSRVVSLEERNVLFIGNSLTYYNDMPQILQQMLNETDSKIKVDQITNPGQSLSGHLSDIIVSRTENGISVRKKAEHELTETEKKIKGKSWDIIILQTGTVAVMIPENRRLKTAIAISEIKELAINPKCKFILFNTWPSKDEYPKQYCYPSQFIDHAIKKEKCCSLIMENLEDEIKLINNSYDEISKELGLLNSDNGNKFYRVLKEYPEIELYEDDSHPNKYGAFLNACIFYQLLTKRKPSDLKFIGEIEPKKADFLKRISE
ncbi:SGNH/GDSL hydrolase family protein [Tenacibaculum xiamenense]|uniref:DUF4886 domain-containing protein n=1 Tax=Tenacibaculum xiamenense TaxID=1261553 RepID=UPI00389662F5